MKEYRLFHELTKKETNLKLLMKGNKIVDLRNLLVPEEAAAAGFEYQSIGR